MISTPFYGNNLCNLLANKLIEEFNNIDVRHKSKIKIIDLNNFIVIKGYTTLSTPLNFSSIFVDYLNQIYEVNRNYNVIDLIEYGNKKSNSDLTISYHCNEYELNHNLFNINNPNEQGYIDLKNDFKTIYTNNINLYNKNGERNSLKVFKVLEPDYFMSDTIFGLSLDLEKIYLIYFKYISYHLFESNTCKDIFFNLNIENNINPIDNENITLDIYSSTNIVKLEWLKSLILDIFNFNPDYIKKHLSLDDYNFENEMFNGDRCWLKRDKISEIILL